MLNLNSPHYQALRSAFSTVLEESDDYEWKSLLRSKKHPNQDGFIPPLEPEFSSFLREAIRPYTEFEQWLVNFPAWSREEILDATKEQPDSKKFALYVLWESFKDGLQTALRAAANPLTLPPSGGILAFVGALGKCMVLEYEITGQVPELEVIAVIDKPRSVFDFWAAIDQTTIRAKNHLKQILGSGHKIIYHRGILNHIDRRTDKHVFGPSIDTLLLSEILHQQAFEEPAIKGITTALEVGSGNGLLTSSILLGCPQLKSLVAIDSEASSIRATQRAVEGVRSTYSRRKAATYYINGAFNPDFFSLKFDLVVCNPPYIPLPPPPLARGRKRYFDAVGGTKLMTDLVSSAGTLLSPQGKLLLMTSSTSIDDFEGSLPPGMRASRPLGHEGFEVVFDVEAVLDTPEWLDYLLTHRNLKKLGDLYMHTLHPVWISMPRT